MRRPLWLAAILLLVGPGWAQNPHDRLTFRFLVDSALRPPNNTLEWVDGSADGVLCFEGIVQHPSIVHLILGEATGCARIVAQLRQWETP